MAIFRKKQNPMITKLSLPDFHPFIKKWFLKSVGNPTGVQVKSWQAISAGKHVLVSAPTGSGKTLAAFLWSINQLVTGDLPLGRMRVLYISPLKALNNDVRRNLIKPLNELKTYFEAEKENFPDIRVLTRSGDTPQKDRRRMLSHPPEILITTPESLNILLGSKRSREILTGVAAVICDEIHAVAGTKRGTHLISAVDRIVGLSGEFQRIALSATIKPMENIADFIGGYRMKGDIKNPLYQKRKVAIIRSEREKTYDIRVRFPENAREKMRNDSWWPALIENFNQTAKRNRTTLFFANSRRLTEKTARLMNESEAENRVYPHHGSLSKEIRLAVEKKLKHGELRGVVATGSLELGIDLGSLDQVVLIQTPMSISSGIQRVGRSGHGVGRTSRGTIFPTHGRDFVNAAVMARAIMDQDIEAKGPVDCPLDVLAQTILSMTCVETWDIDALYAFLKTSYPFHHLTRTRYDLVLDMLSGHYANTRLRELKPRIFTDSIDNTVRAKDGMRYLLHISGGTIPDRGYFDLRVENEGAKIGELDEEFVWERKVGESFALGAQTWRITRITHNDVVVAPVKSKPGMIPFWKAEAQNRDFHFSQKIGEFLEYADEKLESEPLKDELSDVYGMEVHAVEELISYLKRQKEATACELPHRHHLLIEHFDDPLNRADSKQVILHTLWGGRINRPFALSVSAAWEARHGYPLEVFSDDDCILLMLPHAFDTKDLFSLVSAENVEKQLRTRLEKTGFFGAGFRENAGRALLLPRVNFKKRMPLWLNRLRSKKLMDAVMPFEDFPILLETWRACLQDEFDIKHLKLLLDELACGHIRVSETVTHSPSPFAGGLIWRQTNKHMYEDDAPSSGKTSGLKDSLIREVAGSSHLRPRISDAVIRILEQKLQRTADGYAPGTSHDMLGWIKERLFIPQNEWRELMTAVKRDHGLDENDILAPVFDKVIRLELPGADSASVCAVENLPRIIESFGLSPDRIRFRPVLMDSKKTQNRIGQHIAGLFEKQKKKSLSAEQEKPSLADFIAQWLSFCGPIEMSLLKQMTGLDDDMMGDAASSLAKTQTVVWDQFRENSDVMEICDRENLEILLRMVRASRKRSFTALHADALPL
ncbi:DEAD/DEAH box helicase, partial [Thermodesulfobacteriota bacterium]